jgi:hypothetical protein
MPEPVRGLRAVAAGGFDQVLEVSDRTDVVEPVLLAQDDPGRVVAAVFEPLQRLEK